MIGQWLTSSCCKWLGVTCTSSTLRPRSQACSRSCSHLRTWRVGSSVRVPKVAWPASRPWRRLEGSWS
ncbi:hypothetical protein [uncultured Piscinibacter sp.]|uniref:hypothetical protein n=1 Tax=uncultured Piscinibacter sp. TaxID=1131835 RepID=UPI00345C4E3E